MNKKELSERDICTKFITPAIVDAGWDLMKQIREEVFFTDGRIIVQGKLHTRGKGKKADYILYYKPNIPIAIIEAKKNTISLGSGMQQALEYGQILDIPFIFSSNGDGFVFHDKTGLSEKVETIIDMNDFPSPEKLWDSYIKHKGLDTEEKQQLVAQDYHTDDDGMSPRYYQQIAINKTLEAIANGKDRILLVMATGTGKTYTAFHIIWRLRKAFEKKNNGKTFRTLFLADRNALLTQTKNGDFAPFGNDIMHIVKHRNIESSYQVYFALYQGLTGNDDSQNAYKEFSADFFDLVIIDECHRGSASEASAWREILDYFSGAIQVGLTATPKETKDVSNMAYFGEPVYTYSLKEGISDGFLAPYKVIRIATDRDQGWRPTVGLQDKFGNEITDRIYNLRDYDRNLVLGKRTELVAKKITEFLKGTDRFAKTIVFCIDIDHANRMRMALINENADLVAKHPNYVVKITGDDKVGKGELGNFIDVSEPFPVIATTSKMLTTGVNTKMVKLIVLDANIGSMTEFKQIIGRGTRIREKEGKFYFTIMDFRGATNHFADPDFDGHPTQVYEPAEGESVIPPEEDEEGNGEILGDPRPPSDINLPEDGEIETPKKYYVDSVEVKIAHEQVQYYGANGKLITESLKDYTKSNIKKEFRSLDDFIQTWNEADRKAELVKELADKGVFLESLREEVGKDMDAFDLICHVAFGMPPLTRQERAKEVRKRNYFGKYGETARQVLEALLEKYETEGITSIEDSVILKLQPFSQMGSPVELVKAFGKRKDFEKAMKELESELYRGLA
jgi:type I restriction enzyme R subunit